MHQEATDLPTMQQLYLESPESVENLQRAIRQQLWLKGNLRHLTRKHGQRQLYDFAHSRMERFPDELQTMSWLCHRRLGKSFLLCLMCIERALVQPGADVKYACATRRQVRDIVEPMIGLICSTAPRSISIERREGNLYIRLPHWPPHMKSRIMFVGLDYRQGDALRGQACDFAALDEARDIMVLEYVIKSVLAPQFVGRRHPCLIMASTPPESMEHPFVTQYVEPGFRSGMTVSIPASKNLDWSPLDERLVREELGGPGSLAYDREIECRLISDRSVMVIPEFQREGCEPYTALETMPERPEWYIPYVSLDTGWKDHVGCLFAYIDFPRQKMVIVGELFEQYLTLGKIAELVHEKYEELFDEKCRSRAHWVADCDNLELETLRAEHHCPFTFADKYKKEVALADYRTSLMEGKYEIDAMACPHTVRQHKYGVWNKQRTSFQRSETMGHLDLVAAAVYLNKVARWHEQPIPYGKHGLRTGEWRNPWAPLPETMKETRAALGNLLGSRFRKR